MKPTPKTFQRKLILYNLVIIICIASAVSFYNYNSYRKDVIVSETKNSANRIAGLSDRMEVAYDEMVNILLNCSERQSLFLTTSFSEIRDGYDNPKSAINASDVLKDLCAISGYSSSIYKITLYNNGYLLQAGSSFGSSDDPERIMAAPWFSENLTKISGSYTLTLVDNPFSLGSNKTPKILPLLRPLQNVIGAPEDYWVFLGISPSLFQDALNTMPEGSIVCVTTAAGDVIASRNREHYDDREIREQLLAAAASPGTFQTRLGTDQCIRNNPSADFCFMRLCP